MEPQLLERIEGENGLVVEIRTGHMGFHVCLRDADADETVGVRGIPTRLGLDRARTEARRMLGLIPPLEPLSVPVWPVAPRRPSRSGRER